jgi:hypothetical protein
MSSTYAHFSCYKEKVIANMKTIYTKSKISFVILLGLFTTYSTLASNRALQVNNVRICRTDSLEMVSSLSAEHPLYVSPTGNPTDR